MGTSSIDDAKLYELFLKDKEHKEDRRDQINTYYISLLTAVVGIVPFINQMSSGVNTVDRGYLVRLSLIALSLVGLVLAFTWRLNIKRILYYLEFLDKQIETLERKNNITFISYINNQKVLKNWPSRVTKYQLILPFTFIVVFSLTIIYSLAWILI